MHGLPTRPVDGRTPVYQRLGRRGRVSAPNADGWREILLRQETRPAAATTEKQLPQAQEIPANVSILTSSSDQPVATALSALSRRHLARDCKWPRRAATMGSEADVATSTAARCSHESDLLTVVLCEGAGPPVWVDPMLEELAASLVMSRSVVLQCWGTHQLRL